MTSAQSRISLASAAAALALVGVFAGPQPLDDAFITLRYARSLASGDGFVFNPGEHVLGTTTPLFTLLLAALHYVTSIDLVWLAYVLAVAGHMGTVALLVVIGGRCRQPIAGWLAACLYALAPLALRPTIGCMETSVFVLATIFALTPSERPIALWRSGAATAAVLLRPEGVLTAVLHLLQAVYTNPRSAWRTIACLVVGVVPWLLFATWYFGSPVPESILAKWTDSPIPAAEYFWYLLLSLPIAAPMVAFGAFAPQPFGTLIARALPLPFDLEVRRLAILLLGTVVLAVVCVGSIVLHRNNGRIRWLLLFAGGYIATYCVADPRMFPWYLVPPLPVLLLAFVVGGHAILQALLKGAGPPLAAAVGIGLLCVAAWQSSRLIRSYPLPRERAYRLAVQDLGAAAQDRAVLIGAMEVGTIGYYSQARIFDYFGLVSPEARRLGTAGAIERYRPTFYIGQQAFFALSGLYRNRTFVEEYELLARMPGEARGGSATLVYARRTPQTQK